VPGRREGGKEGRREKGGRKERGIPDRRKVEMFKRGIYPFILISYSYLFLLFTQY
jgi:hypothetical protein